MDRRFLLPLAVSLVVCTLIGAVAWTAVKTARRATIDVTGSAKRRILADLVEWEARLSTQAADRAEASRALKKELERTNTHLKSKGITDAELRVSAVLTEERVETEWVGSGDNRVERTVSRGWEASQRVRVRSSDVAKVERISREVTSLLEDGVPIVSFSPAYHYTRLGELKIEMLAEASADARARAQRMIASAGGDAKLGTLERVDMGVINVNPANSTETSWQGNNDTTSLEKDIITIVHVSYRIAD